MNRKGNRQTSCRWGVILAGGDGAGLLTLTRKMFGDDRPKQFCPVIGNETLLRQTQLRISCLVPKEQTLVVMTRKHERYFGEQRNRVPAYELLIQPSDKGTSAAILYSLLRIRELDPDGTVAFFPSDHHFSNDAVFISHMERAYAEAVYRPRNVVLLGIPPSAPEVEFGWIEASIGSASTAPDFVKGGFSSVSRFWEKPHKTLASALMARGCLWNSFVMVGHVDAFLRSMRQALPDLVEAFEPLRLSLATDDERKAANGVYSNVCGSSFCEDVLSVRPSDLSVLCSKGLGWTDLGEPYRVQRLLESMGVGIEIGYLSREYSNVLAARP